jgi:N-acetylglucosaminyl-diphospho-decaprenol L-rhamnosyltransferase
MRDCRVPPQTPAQLDDVAVVVVNFGTHDETEGNLVRSVGPDFPGQVVVADNYSSAAEREAMARACERHGWHLVGLATNEGYGGGCNRAADHALAGGARELLFLNPDAHLDREGIHDLQAMVRDEPRTLVAPLVVRPDGSRAAGDVDLHLRSGHMSATWKRPEGTSDDDVHRWVSGACFMVSADLWREVGGFDESYFLYWEDVDLCRRVVTAGGHVRAEPSVTAVHDEGSSHRVRRSEAKSAVYYYYNTRNRLLYAAKHLDAAQQRRWVLSTPAASYRILLRGGRRQLVRVRSTWWPAVRGSWDGLRLWWALRRGTSPNT